MATVLFRWKSAHYREDVQCVGATLFVDELTVESFGEVFPLDFDRLREVNPKAYRLIREEVERLFKEKGT